jgi:hypothetical protein
MKHLRTALLVLLIAPALGGCGGDDGGDDEGETETPLFPADYAASYQQVRNCRFSLEHDLVRVRVLASPDALTAYNGRTAPFPTGAVVIKEEYAESDTTCAGPIQNISVMQKLAAGAAPGSLDWSWQEVDGEHRTVTPTTSAAIRSCTSCHSDCGKPPEGYDGTCTVP